MLVLSRKVGEKILIGNNIVVTVVKVQGDKIRLGFEAPIEIVIIREELKAQVEQPQEQATHDVS